VPAPSRRLLPRALLAAVLGLTAAFAVACGSSGGSDKGLLSSAQSGPILSALSSISSAVHAHSCARARTAVAALDRSLQDLPSQTSTKLVQNLGHGASTVSQLALTQCRPAPSTKTTTTTTAVTTPATTSTTATTTTTVPTTQSTPTTPSTPQTTPETTPSTPTPTTGSGSGGNGGGNGNGNGNGGAGGGAGLTGGGSQ